tara:strand:+ start:39678 stop:39785 length:108 start_codon:yes stop_codon:yes gene_type:complete
MPMFSYANVAQAVPELSFSIKIKSGIRDANKQGVV